ncbi:hypothetical protein [Edaphobacter flagellatus]|uniref:hypothetical protein n=1 Tax=Edaphobacter flagellatus TaxID=1933044 RepID=UPI0021B25B77|nr:hypothetical protein [Edaphobacter flagellatus]
MLVPSIIHANSPLRKLTGCVLAAISLLFVTNPAQAKGPTPAKRIPLEPLGFQLPQNQFLLAGSSMMTLDYVDDKHLLVTYTAKRLLKRIPDCPPSDQDRVIDAVLVELPEGKPLARTTWRLHDRGQYLWNLGHGRFMLRIRDTLTTIAPLVNQSKGDAFKEHPFIETKRKIGAVIVSPDADLLILETTDPPAPAGLEEATGATNGAPYQKTDNPVQINFFTLEPRSGDEIQIIPGTSARSRTPGRIPANSSGYLSIVDQGQQHWAFDFNTYGGKKLELAPFDSLCRPSAMLVSRGEFIAFGCHITHTPQIIGGFNMRGEEMWEQNLTETYLAPSFAFAPAAGRFAFSRILTHTSLVAEESLQPELVAGQDIVVYQNESGRQVLHTDATPVARAGQNFALSPDGMSLAVIHTDTIDIYSLPPLSGKDREAMKLAEAAAPKPEPAPVSQALVVSPPSAAETPAANLAPPEPKAPAAAAPSAADTAAAESAQPETTPKPAAEAQPDASAQTSGSDASDADAPPKPRKPPTLYNPGEQPDAKQPKN